MSAENVMLALQEWNKCESTQRNFIHTKVNFRNLEAATVRKCSLPVFDQRTSVTNLPKISIIPGMVRICLLHPDFLNSYND
jgi:hypothetical protein